MSSRIPDFQEPLDWVLMDQNGQDPLYEDQFVAATRLDDSTIDTDYKQQEDSSDSDSFEMVDDNKFILVWHSAEEDLLAAMELNPKGCLRGRIRTAPSSPCSSPALLTRECGVVEGEIFSSLLTRNRTYSNPESLQRLASPSTPTSEASEHSLDQEELLQRYLAFSDTSSAPASPVPPDYLEHFPKELYDMFGYDAFAQIPYRDLSGKKVTDLQAEDLPSPFMLFSNSSEGHSGIIMLTTLDNKRHIEVYHGRKETTENWFLTKLPLDKINKTKKAIEKLEQRISSKNRGERRNALHGQKSIQMELLEAHLVPVPVALASAKEKLQTLWAIGKYQTTILASQ